MRTKKFLILSLWILLPFLSSSQTFYRVGADTNKTSQPLFGILLAGGAIDNDNAMRWLAQLANGGDVVVLRATGDDLYNNYIYTQLDVEVNSVTTIVVSTEEQADSDTVCQAISQADMIFLAGGNQWHYYNEWKNTCLHEALQYHVNQKSAPIGGTSAGLAVLGEVVFTAENNSVWSEEALGNPYHWRMKLANDFLDIPYMNNIVTDSHYNRIHGDDNHRKGRHVAFMARMVVDWDMQAKGIGVNEYTAVAVNENGIAKVFGNPGYPDYAYFLKANAIPEICETNTPLTWYNQGNALTVYRIAGNNQGNGAFDLNNWETAEGGSWWKWYVDQGELYEADVTSIEHPGLNSGSKNISIYPNPADSRIFVNNATSESLISYRIFDVNGQVIFSENNKENENLFIIDVSEFTSGVYLFYLYFENEIVVKKIIKK